MMISKSSYKKYIMCPKALWLHINKPEVASEMTEFSKENIQKGNTIGNLAKKLFSNIVNCSIIKPNGEPNYDMQIISTKQALQNGAAAIAEASFRIDNLFCAVDVLKKDGEGYSIYEVKSSLDIKESQLLDIAFQKFVLDKCDIDVKHIYIMHPDRHYSLNGTLDLSQYFKIECVDTNELVIKYYNEIADTINGINKVLESASEPIFSFCSNCNDCEFNKYCTRDIPDDCVGELYGISTKAYGLYNKGIMTIADYVQTQEYNESKKNLRRDIQIKKVLEKDNTPYVDRDKLSNFLDNIRYPLYHLDFETTSKIVPEFEGFHPGESYPFQYSLHIEQADGSIEHKEFLGEEENCICALAEQLVKDIPIDSQLIAYNATTEINVIKYLAKKSPNLSDHLINLTQNFVDLCKPFKDGLYYDPKQKGSNSIKAVMPALCSDMKDAYHNLPNVHNGTEASLMFPMMIAMKNLPNYDEVRKGMLEYCELDTFSMVKVLSVLKQAIK